MSMLMLKAWRDTLAHKGQFLALIALVALGITSYVTFQNGYYDLKASLDRAYSQLRFADVDVRADHLPPSLAGHAKRIPGVSAAEVRTVQDVGLDLAGGEQATARIVSTRGARASVNAVTIEQGRFPGDNGRDEVLLSPQFASDTGIGPGDRLTLRIGGKRRSVRVSGIGTDPEYLYAMQSKGDIPVPGSFAILFVTEKTAGRLLGASGSGNDLIVRARPGTNLERLSDRLEDELDPYGVQSTSLREDQPGYQGLQNELEQNRLMARSMPALVLVISSMSLFIALSRLVQSQRGEIGLAKALGYSDAQILLNYFAIAMIVAAGGSALGLILGILGARGIAASYVGMLGIPFLESGFYPAVAAIAVGMAFVSCAAAAVIPAWRSSRLAPAVAMHADPNQSLSGGGIPLVEHVLSPVLPATFTVRVPLRNVFRSRRRSLYTVLGITFAMVLSVSTVAMFDSIDYLIGRAFTSVERWDVMAAFSSSVGEGRIAQVGRIDGVERIQRAAGLPVKLTFAGLEEDAVITAAAPGQEFHGFEGGAGASAAEAMEAGDLVLAQSMAKELGVAVGGRVEVDSPLLDDPVRLRVGAISDEIAGQPAFVSLDTATRRLGLPANTYNLLYLSVDPRRASRIQDEIYDMPGAASVQVKADLMSRLRDLMKLMNFFGVVLFAFGAALAFVVVFTTFTANVTERTREIATMRTIGEDDAHLALMVTLENLALAVVGLPLGIWLGVLATDALFASFSTDSYSLKAVIFPGSVARISALMLIVMVLSEIPPVRRIFRLDLAEATKVME